jgi:plasmid replication initiation protein
MTDLPGAQTKPLPEKILRTLDIKGSGNPLDPHNAGSIIKPSELVDIVEITPLNRSEMILYNQLLSHSWDTIEQGGIHRILKSVLRGSHESNDRLHAAFDSLMGAWAKVHYKDKAGKQVIGRVHLIGANTEEEEEDGYFYYRFPPELLSIISNSRTWAKLKSQIMYALRSKYSIRLYEMVEKRIGLNKQSEYFTIDEFRGLLGVQKDKLPRFADFNKHCLKPALQEVNQLTDFEIQIGAVKRGRAVEKLMLTWYPKSGDSLREAHRERERSKVGRSARRKGQVEIISFE